MFLLVFMIIMCFIKMPESFLKSSNDSLLLLDGVHFDRVKIPNRYGNWFAENIAFGIDIYQLAFSRENQFDATKTVLRGGIERMLLARERSRKTQNIDRVNRYFQIFKHSTNMKKYNLKPAKNN